MRDPIIRDALERNIGYRLALCDEAELRKLDDALLALERRRFAVEEGLAELATNAPTTDRFARHPALGFLGLDADEDD